MAPTEGATTGSGDVGKVGGAGGTNVSVIGSRFNSAGHNTGYKAVDGV